MAFLSEAAVEEALLTQLAALGYAVEREEDIGPDGHRPEREGHDEVVLQKRLAEAVARLNPALPPEARHDAVRKVTQSELPNLLEENRRIHRLLTEGVDVEYYAEDGTLTAGKVWLIDFDRPERNDWLAVSQFVVIARQYKRRPDVVVFVNGLPLGVIELKAPGVGNANTTVQVGMFEYRFDLDKTTVPSGNVTFVITNKGTEVHNFDLGGIKAGQILAPGQSETWTVALPPKNYVYVCDVPFHVDRGMTGQLTVTQ